MGEERKGNRKEEREETVRPKKEKEEGRGGVTRASEPLRIAGEGSIIYA